MWIPVTERLPNKGRWVLVARADGGPVPSYRSASSYWCGPCPSDVYTSVTHWYDTPPAPVPPTPLELLDEACKSVAAARRTAGYGKLADCQLAAAEKPLAKLRQLLKEQQ